MSSEKITTKQKSYYKKNNYYKLDYKIENLSRASSGGIHVLSSGKVVTKKKLLKKQIYYNFYYYDVCDHKFLSILLYLLPFLRYALSAPKCQNRPLFQILKNMNFFLSFPKIFVHFALSVTVSEF